MQDQHSDKLTMDIATAVESYYRDITKQTISQQIFAGETGLGAQFNNKSLNQHFLSPMQGWDTVDCSLAKRSSLTELTSLTPISHRLDSFESKEPKVQTYQIHGRVRQFTTKLNRTHRICELMTKVLTGEEVELQDFALEGYEVRLFECLVARKFNNSNVEEHSDVPERFNNFCHFVDNKKLIFTMSFSTIPDPEERCRTMKSFIDFLQNLKLTKRVEENNKFVYKHSTSYLLTQYVLQNNLKFNSATEGSYYSYYFGDHATKHSLDVSDFCDPLKTSIKGCRKAKSLNTDYILRILTCEKFRADFFKYLYDGFERDYLSATYKKLERMLMVLENRLQPADAAAHDAILDHFIESKINHRWCKIPWCKNEVSASIAHFVKYFSDLLSKTLHTASKGSMSRLHAPSGLEIWSGRGMISQVSAFSIGDNTRCRNIEITSIGTILNHKRVKRHSLALYAPSEFCVIEHKLNIKSNLI